MIYMYTLDRARKGDILRIVEAKSYGYVRQLNINGLVLGGCGG